MAENRSAPMWVAHPPAETADASLLRQSHFAAGWDAGRASSDVEVERLRGVAAAVRKHYPTIAGHVLRLQQANEDRAAAEWLAIAQDFFNALLKLDSPGGTND